MCKLDCHVKKRAQSEDVGMLYCGGYLCLTGNDRSMENLA